MTPRSARSLGRLAFPALLALLAGCASEEPVVTEMELPQTTFTFDKGQPSYEIFAQYNIKPGDVLDVLYHIDQHSLQDQFILKVDHQIAIKFPDAPELNEAQAIRPDGTISLPYVGIAGAAGKTVQQLTDELRARYAELIRTEREREFRIAANQIVAVKFVKIPELNEVQAVRADGAISLPYLGVVQVEGKTVGELTQELAKGYQGVLESPELYVVVSDPEGRDQPPDYLREGTLAELYIVVTDFRAVVNEFKQDLHTAPRGLSRLVTVRPDGYATFALVGDISVAGKTIPEVDQVLDGEYKQILDGLSVDLFLEEHAGANVYVLGEVAHPGAYSILKPTPVLKVLALSGGTLPEANMDSLMIVRRHQDRMIATRINLDRLFELEEGADLFYLQPDDIVYVPRRGLSQAAVIAREIADVIFFRGWGVSLDPIRLAD
ncbi:MAG: polysaccharide biosynthesis/export family protein [Planctomycetes bacterium]|nr:polysaccharide biosynthesis/export family protein [Planctomycetota bacterium]